MATNPCQLKGAGTTKRGERPTLSVAEIGQLADEVPGRYSALVHLLAWSGARIGELAILRVGGLNLDPDAPSVFISERVYLINGVYDVDTPKSAAGRRRIALPPHLVPILLEHVETYRTGQPDHLVFTSSTGGPVLCGYSQILSRALVRIGRPDARVHDLRHTGMTLAAEAGASLADLKLRLVHRQRAQRSCTSTPRRTTAGASRTRCRHSPLQEEPSRPGTGARTLLASP